MFDMHQGKQYVFYRYLMSMCGEPCHVKYSERMCAHSYVVGDAKFSNVLRPPVASRYAMQSTSRIGRHFAVFCDVDELGGEMGLGLGLLSSLSKPPVREARPSIESESVDVAATSSSLGCMAASDATRLDLTELAPPLSRSFSLKELSSEENALIHSLKSPSGTT